MLCIYTRSTHQLAGSLTSLTKTVELSLVVVFRLSGQTQMHRLSVMRSPNELSCLDARSSGAKIYIHTSNSRLHNNNIAHGLSFYMGSD